MKIYAPVKDFNGLRNNVRFVNGVGETDNPELLSWFKSHGYKVPLETTQFSQNVQDDQIEKNDDEIAEVGKIVSDEPDFDSMTPNELRDWMRANGYGAKIKNTRNKEKLLEILRG